MAETTYSPADRLGRWRSGLNEKAVRKAVETGRIKRADDGKFDLEACRDAWRRSNRSEPDPRCGPLRTVHKVRSQRVRRSAPLFLKPTSARSGESSSACRRSPHGMSP